MKVLISDLADKANIKFGTSGLRGLVTDLSDQVCFAYTQAFLQSTPIKEKRVVIGHDLRPSTLESLKPALPLRSSLVLRASMLVRCQHRR